jgi:hypothetical protein
VAYSSIFVVVQYTENLASEVTPRNIERRSSVLLFHCDDKTLVTTAGLECVVIARQNIAVPCDGLVRSRLMR